MKDQKTTKKRSSRDYLIPIVLGLTVLFAAFIVYKIASPIMEKNRYQKYINEFLHTVNESKETDEVFLDYEGETYILPDDYVSWLYYMLSNRTLGYSTDADPEPVITVRFPNSSVLIFSETEILVGPRTGKQGLFVRFINEDGKPYQFYTDMYYLRSIEDPIREFVEAEKE